MTEITKISRISPVIQTLPARKKVAAYARVSAENEAELRSLAAQVSFYSGYIRQNSEWEYAGVYADSGLSGTSVGKRAEFRRLIADCERGKIDIILTKSISRFARNTVDLLETVRHLREIGVEVRFEREHIRSLDGDGELMLTILSSFAQEESRSISENVKWGIRRGFENGKTAPHTLYGYRAVNGKLEIQPDEAEIVRLIYDNFLNGKTIKQTIEELEKSGAKTLRGGSFSRTAIYDILHNEKYTGNSVLQKYFIEDHISHKKRKNRGEMPMYLVENSHEAIIDKETFDKVQEIIISRREGGIFSAGAVETSCFTSKIKCGKCGRNYRRYGRYNKKGERKFSYWGCSTRKKSIRLCDNEIIPEEQLKAACAFASGDKIFDEEHFSGTVREIIVKENGTPEFIFYGEKTSSIIDRREST